jgi:hypothetical protein
MNKGFPVRTDKYPSLEQFAKEGRLLAASLSLTSGLSLPSQVTSGLARTSYNTWTTGVASGYADVAPGEAWIGARFQVTADRACTYNGAIVQGGHITQTAELGGSIPVAGVFPDGGGVHYIDCPHIMYEKGRISFSFQSPGTAAKPLEQPIISITAVSGISVTMDFNYSADKLLLISGDSISWAGERIGYKENSAEKLSGRIMFGHRVADALRDEGKNVRCIMKGFGSMVQNEADNAFQNGWYDGINYDLHICSRGTNDVPATITTQVESDFKSSLKKVIIHRNRYSPKASIIFVAPFPSDAGANRIANLETVRQWVQDVATDSVLGGTDRKVYFYNGGTAFTLNATPSLDTNFACGAVGTAGERASGSRLHLGELGHLAAFNGLYPVVQQTDFYLGL